MPKPAMTQAPKYEKDSPKHSGSQELFEFVVARNTIDAKLIV